MIKKNKMKNAAGIASERTANIYGMKVVANNIESNKQNYTRFLILSGKDSEPTGNDKTSVIFTAEHTPGALYKAIGIFAVSDINLTKIESRPISGKPWEYNFFLDFEGHREDRIIKEALEILKHNALFLKIIGSYPKAKRNIR
jgi:chorismate mutase/prephenate dehydratase